MIDNSTSSPICPSFLLMQEYTATPPLMSLDFHQSVAMSLKEKTAWWG